VSKPPSPFLWCAVGGLLLAGTGLFATADAARWDWQPALALAEPWRWWTAAFVHWSRLHLVANLTGLLVVMALGWAARLPAVSAVAWFIAWPLTQLGLLLRPELTHFGGLSGVLHAGVAVAGWHVLRHSEGRRRWVGAGLAAGLLVKLLSEQPWGPVLRHPADWDIAVAPLAHATGAVFGGLCAAVLDRRSRRQTG
jgi:rhomboid family GlyGly-CTERM serine protease